jgi:hypothetical protein
VEQLYLSDRVVPKEEEKEEGKTSGYLVRYK